MRVFNAPLFALSLRFASSDRRVENERKYGISGKGAFFCFWTSLTR
jgi:hypothetical protein